MQATRRTRSVAERLQAKLVERPNGCLEFTGFRMPRGYGRIGLGRKGDGTALTHRVAWEIANGPIPDDMCVCHHCDNPPCCNVDHLFLGTYADNARDMAEKGRAYRPTPVTHCKRGHPFDEDNTYRPPDGGRSCRACHRLLARRYRRNKGVEERQFRIPRIDTRALHDPAC